MCLCISNFRHLSICKFVTRSWNWWKYEYGSNWVFCMSGFQLIDPVAKKRMEIDKGLRFDICRDTKPLYCLFKFHKHSRNIFWVMDWWKWEKARNCGVLCHFAFGTQLWNHVADKKKEIKVWDLKYAETYTPSIYSKRFIYIVVIYYKL